MDETEAARAMHAAMVAFRKRPSRANRAVLDAALDAYQRAVWGGAAGAPS